MKCLVAHQGAPDRTRRATQRPHRFRLDCHVRRNSGLHTHAGLISVLARHGRSFDGTDEDVFATEEPVLASCAGASSAELVLFGEHAGQRTNKLRRTLRLVSSDSSGSYAEFDGVNIHAGVGSTTGALLVGLTIGGTGGVVVGRMTVEPRIVEVEIPAVAPPSAVETPSVEEEEEVAPPLAVEPEPSEIAPPPVSADAPRAMPSRRVTEADLEAEQMLIDAARAALARENPSQARELLVRHRAQFPSGALREEREGLEVLVLLRTDPERARGAAARFARRYPESLLWPAIERALRRDSHEPESP